MASFIQSVDARTRLAGANQLEVLLFSLGQDQSSQRDEVFGINVFKVREGFARARDNSCARYARIH